MLILHSSANGIQTTMTKTFLTLPLSGDLQWLYSIKLQSIQVRKQKEQTPKGFILFYR